MEAVKNFITTQPIIVAGIIIILLLIIIYNSAQSAISNFSKPKDSSLRDEIKKVISEIDEEQGSN